MCFTKYAWSAFESLKAGKGRFVSLFSVEPATLSKPSQKEKNKNKNKQPEKRKNLAADSCNEININGFFLCVCVFCTHTFRLGSPAVKEERENTEPQHSNEELCELNP